MMNNVPHDDIDNFNIFDLIQNDCFSLFDIVLTNLDIYNFHINSKNEQGDSLLHLICAKGNVHFAQKLLKMGSDVNLTNKNHQTPLHLAVSSGNVTLVKLLLAHDALPNQKDKNGEGPVFEAARNGHLDILKQFTTSHKYLTDKKNLNDEGLLHVAVRGGQAATVEYLIGTGHFDLEARSADGSTPLHLAFDVASAEALLKKGANPNAKDAKSRSLLHLAVERKDLELCKLLVERGGVEVDGRDGDGATALHRAVGSDAVDIAFLLVRHGADVDAEDLDGYTPLHVAAAGGNGNLVKFLLKSGAADGARTFNGDTALHLAAAAGGLEAVAALAGGGGDGVLNKDGYSPVQLAEINGHRKVVKLLAENRRNYRPLSKIPKAVHRAVLSFPSGRATISL